MSNCFKSQSEQQLEQNLSDFEAAAQYAATKTKTYADGTTATGPGLLPEQSPAEQDAAAHQCCGKCEKPLAERVADNFAATMEQSMRTGPEPTHYSGLGGEPAKTVTETVSVEGYESRPEVLRAVIEDLAQRLHQADVVITALVLQAGGVVTISGEDADKVVGHRIECEAVYGSGGYFTFRAVPVPEDAPNEEDFAADFDEISGLPPTAE